MNNTSPEVVRVGVGAARITRVTPKQVECIDAAGQERSVELEKCATNWSRYHDENRNEFTLVSDASSESVAEWNSCCVGQRGGQDFPWVVFMNERCTRFEFNTYDEMCLK